MPGLWWGLDGVRVRGGGHVAYARALGAGHHHGAASIVDPMNASELMTTAALVFAATPHLGLSATASYAHPLFAHGGNARGAAGAGVAWQAGRAAFELGVQLPVVGDAFRVRAVAGATLNL
jgi:hypothetical protein